MQFTKFQKHHKKVCKNEKVQWIEYVREFLACNQDIPDEYFGRWVDILNKIKDQNGNENLLEEKSTRQDPATQNLARPFGKAALFKLILVLFYALFVQWSIFSLANIFRHLRSNC